MALTRVAQGEALAAVVQRLLRQAAQAGVQAKLLLLDRGFYSVEVMRYLQAAGYPFILPVVVRGRQASHPQGPSGTRVFALQKHSGWRPSYRLSNAARRSATVSIAIHCRNWQGRRGRQGRQTLVYAFWGLAPKTTHWVYQVYRQRFGIETSYRQLNEACIKTTTRNPMLRLLFVGIALLLRNLWVWLHWTCLASPRRGGRQLNPAKLRFKTLLLWLANLAEQVFGINDFVIVDQLPPAVSLTWNY